MLYMVASTLVATVREHQKCPEGATLLAPLSNIIGIRKDASVVPEGWEHQKCPEGEGGMNSVQNR